MTDINTKLNLLLDGQRIALAAIQGIHTSTTAATDNGLLSDIASHLAKLDAEIGTDSSDIAIGNTQDGSVAGGDVAPTDTTGNDTATGGSDTVLTSGDSGKVA